MTYAKQNCLNNSRSKRFKRDKTFESEIISLSLLLSFFETVQKFSKPSIIQINEINEGTLTTPNLIKDSKVHQATHRRLIEL